MSATAFDPGTDCWCACGEICAVTAAYIWVSANSGYRIRLCVPCCANWRVRAEVEPDQGRFNRSNWTVESGVVDVHLERAKNGADDVPRLRHEFLDRFWRRHVSRHGSPAK